MVEKFKEILQSLLTAHSGGVYIFAIMQMDELVDKWTVVLSASWATEETRKEVFEEIRSLLVGKLDTKQLSSIARIGQFSKTEHLIEELLKYQKGAVIENTRINGNLVYKGYILESSPQA